jgi:uncharacterized Zn-binding protein involved in type VI secretion
MRSPIREHDKLEQGGEVTSGSPFTTFMGRRLARVGDTAQCDLHGNTTIAEGDTRFPDRDGQPNAMHHHRCVCGCRLISSLENVNFA